VEVSLPPKTETKIMCPLAPAQTFWYRRLLMRESGAMAAIEGGGSRAGAGGEGGEGGEEVGPGRNCSPHHPTHFDPSSHSVTQHPMKWRAISARP
jgi:hypothetical protein